MRIRWTEPAVRDLKGLCDYIAERDGDEQARRIALRIYDGVNSLADFPRRGRIGRKQGTREFVFQGLPWLAVYRIRDETVEIDRILHGAQRFP
jgi:addiction module RelE/StbE family toxin